MKQTALTAVTDEVIEPGCIVRVKIGNGLQACKVDHVTPRGAISIRTMLPAGDGWAACRSVAPADVWYLVSQADARSLGLPA